jgi:hypothetical protein
METATVPGSGPGSSASAGIGARPSVGQSTSNQPSPATIANGLPTNFHPAGAGNGTSKPARWAQPATAQPQAGHQRTHSSGSGMQRPTPAPIPLPPGAQQAMMNNNNNNNRRPSLPLQRPLSVQHSGPPSTLTVASAPFPPPTQQQRGPSAGPSSATTAQTAFPSPTLNHANVNPKFTEDRLRLTFAIQQALPQAVRQSIRDNWEKCSLNSIFHETFLVGRDI